MDRIEALRYRVAPLDMPESEFRRVGRHVVERIADWQCTLPKRPVAPDETAEAIREALGVSGLPEHGADAQALLDEAASLLFEHSTFNGHPRFMAVITSSAAPIGALGDLLAAAVNPNVGGWLLSPMATAIEEQSIRWIAELISYPTDCGGLLVSGGNMGNFVGLLAARTAKLPWDVRKLGLSGGDGRQLRLYASQETHGWLLKAVDMFGLGTDAVRWIPVDAGLRMDTQALRQQIQADRAEGDAPFLVVGTAGTVGTGAVDPLPEIAAICREYDLWFHVDGAYGGFAAALLNGDGAIEVPRDLRGISLADSVAVDPHKWLYAPLEAGCVLVRDAALLRRTFSHHAAYLQFAEGDDSPINYHEYGPQNSRGFRALKVWLALRQAGRVGYVRMIADDILLSRQLSRLVETEPELQTCTQGLSVTTFRYVPEDLTPGAEEVEAYLNRLNAEVLARLQRSGEAFLSNAIVGGAFLLRACIVNFRTSLEDVEAIPGIVVRIGREVDAALRRGVLEQSAS